MNETGKTKGEHKRLTLPQRLASFKPIAPKYKFFTSWDPKKRVLRYGCGHGENAVFVRSDRKLEWATWTDESSAKISPKCAQQFLARAPRIDGKHLLTRCTQVLRSYVHLCDERLYSLVSAWTVGTYLYAIFSHYGYLFFHSVFPRSGKTRMEEILSDVCFEATVPLNAPTVPTIRETAAEGHTLILDTLERWKDKNPESHSAAMELLDAGFRNGGTVIKMVSVEGNWKRQAFQVYAPYVMAAISRDSLTDTALDRSFVIEMRRKPISMKKRKYSFHRCEQECEPLRDDLYRWALENAAEVATVYESAELEAQVDSLELNDRAADIWKPLLAVARVIGGPEVWQSLTSVAVETARDSEAAERERVRAIAQSLRKLVNGSGAAVGITSGFVKHLLMDGVEVTDHELHDMLSQWGFSQESVRLDQGPRRAWELQDSKLEEIERENAPVSPSQNVTTVTTKQEPET